MATLGYIALAIIVGILQLLILWFGLGALHQHLRNRGEGFGRDAELHTKMDLLIEENRSAAISTKH